jgi:hypothetical protein
MEPELPLEAALSAVGELVGADGERVAIVVVGGATLNLLGVVRRGTSDVDVIARAYRDEAEDLRLERAEPFPPTLARAIQTVARDFGLSNTWMNADVGKQWERGLPPGLLEDTTWRNYGGGLDVGMVGRQTLIALKLFAAADGGQLSVHVQDLLALAPTAHEMGFAAAWVRTQDAANGWASLVEEVIAHVERNRA